MRVAGAFLKCIATCVAYAGVAALVYGVNVSFTQPYPSGGEGVPAELIVACLVGASLAVLIPVDLFVQWLGHTHPRDLVYRPTAAGLQAAWTRQGPRLVLIVTGMLIVCYLAEVAFELWRASLYPHGLTWGPHYLLYASVLGWGGAWIADTLTRPQRGTFVAAVVFTAWMGLALAGLAFGVTLE